MAAASQMYEAQLHSESRRASGSAPEGQLLQFYRQGAGYGSTEPSVAAIYKRRGAAGGVEQQRSELGLLWGLGWPLLIGKVSDEISWLMIYHYWGSLGSAVSGAGYDGYAGMMFALVFISGAQQGLYTMVPQATGAGNPTQVGVLLQLVLLWNTVAFGIPTALAWASMGSVMRHTGMLSVAAPNCGVGGNATLPHEAPPSAADLLAMEHEATLISSYGLASVAYLAPYVWCMTLTTWLESVEVVQEAETIAACGSLAKIFLTWLFMFRLDGGLNGFAWASAVAYSGQLAALLTVVFVWKRHHAPYWRGWDLAATMDTQLTRRFLWLSAPLIFQYATNNVANLTLQMLMSSECEDLASAYGVTSSFTNTAGSVSMALYVAVSVRVGTNLGEGRPLAARRVMWMGFGFASVAGGLIAIGLYAFRSELAHFFTDDEGVHALAVSVAGHVSLYYFLNSVLNFD